MKGFDYMVKITDNYFYEADGTQYTLIHKGTRPKGKFGSKESDGEMIEFTETIGYYTTIGAMLTSCAKRITAQKVANGEITTISEHISALKQLKNQLECLAMDF